MKANPILVILLFPGLCWGFQGAKDDELYELARKDLAAFAKEVSDQAENDAQRAEAIVSWLARNFDWTATDYKKRTVQEIVERKGGNCNELAMVTTSLLDSLGLPMRRVREINIHVRSDRRQASAEAKMREKGDSMSVFGRQHNDHVWVEIYDRSTGEWFPADPSLGVVGTRQWLQSRLGFETRFSLDPSSKDMIAPFAIFAYDKDSRQIHDRTRHYLIEGFDALYENRLGPLEAWSEWERWVGFLNDKALGAFQGKVNLHDYSAEIALLARAYAALGAQYRRESKSEQ